MEWTAMLVLGAYHGINPGLGWLFAVALGMQRGTSRAVWRALPPIALGHAAAVGIVCGIAVVAQVVVPLEMLKIVVAAVLMLLGGYRLWRHRHPAFGGMLVGFRDLTVWSFLMASAHGAGFMVLPFLIATPGSVAAAAGEHAHHSVSAVAGGSSSVAVAIALHTLAYLLVTASTAWMVYCKLGLALLRSAWFNMDWLWAGALLTTGAIVLFA